MSDIKPCPFCGEPLTVDSPEDWKPTFYDPDSGGDPYNASRVCGFSFCNGSYEFADFVTAVNRRADGWIAVEEDTPKSGEHVLLCCEIRPGGKKYVCDGYYAKSKSIEACGGDEYASEHDEETDEYYLLEGWYEVIKNWDDFSSIVVSDFVTHWQLLPSPPLTTANGKD